MAAQPRQQQSDVRAPPHSVESEQAVLGGLMLDNASWAAACDVLVAGDFYRHDHQLIYDAISDLLSNNEPADAVTVSELLASKDLSHNTGGLLYLAQLVRDTPSAANVGAYASIIRERSRLRGLISVGRQLSAKGHDPEGRQASELLADAQQKITEIGRVPNAQRSDPRRPMLWGQLADQSPPVRKWRISHWLTTAPTLLAGAGGIGKTLLAQTIATALALGRRFLDDVHEKQVVLFWACEDDHDELWRRQIAICKYFGVSMSELTDWLIIEPRLGRDNTLFAPVMGALAWTPLRDELKAQVRDYGAHVLFLDNIGQTFGADENKRHHVTSFINGLAGLAGDYPFTPVIMGHPAKAQGSEFAGNAAWENAVRMRWYMGSKLPDQEDESEPDPNVRYICKRKTNYSVKDWRRLTYREGVFSPEDTQQGQFSMRYGGGAGNRNEAVDSCVLHALEMFSTSAMRVTSGKTSPDYLPKKMREAKMAADYSPRELAEAITRLQLAGRIVEADGGTYGNRSGTRTALVVKK